MAAQNSAIRTNHIKARIDKTQQNSKCRLCGDRDETINHIISECSKLAQKEYKARHDWVGKVIHWEMCKKFKFDHTNKWYMHNPAPVLENDTHKLPWDFDIQTDHLISARKPDLIIIKIKKICKIVDFAVPADHKIKMKESGEKRDKYLDLARELRKIWNMKVTIIPILIGAFGTVTKGLLKGLEDLEVGGRVEIIQTTALLNSHNTEKSPGDLRRLAVTQSPVKDHQLTLMWKTLMSDNNNNNNYYEESWRLEETFCHLYSREKPLANAGVKNTQNNNNNSNNNDKKIPGEIPRPRFNKKKASFTRI